MNHLSKNITIIVLSSFLFSCALTTDVSQTEYQGKKATIINCSGANIDISECYKRANSLCPKGYSVLSREIPDVKNPFPLFTHVGIAIELATIMNKEKIKREKKGLIIQCKPGYQR